MAGVYPAATGDLTPSFPFRVNPFRMNPSPFYGEGDTGGEVFD
jgi:hypothetical protein